MSGEAWEFGILGPLEIRRGNERAQVTSQKQRAVLAMLLLAPNRVVSTGVLIDGLWGDAPPPTAGAALQVHVGKLRQILGGRAGSSTITTRAPGYVVELDRDALDLTRFEDLVRQGRAELSRARPSDASALLHRALACWRGPALADVADEPFASAAIVRLEEERLAVLSDRFAADLDRGAHAEIVGELYETTAAHPLRERFWEQLMLALYRCGNQAEALGAFQSVRHALLEELGLEPGSALRDLEAAVLDQSPALDLAHPPPVRVQIASTIFEEADARPGAFLECGDRRIPLSARTTLGRHPSNTVVVDDAKASREHAVIRVTDDGYALQDLRSTNGTFVNGERVDDARLHDGDTVTIGRSELVFHLDHD